MLARSLDKIETQNFGFAVDGRVEVAMNPPAATYTIPKLNALYRELESRLTRLPGVRGAGLALYNPLTNNWGELVLVAGHRRQRWTARWAPGPCVRVAELGYRSSRTLLHRSR